MYLNNDFIDISSMINELMHNPPLGPVFSLTLTDTNGSVTFPRYRGFGNEIPKGEIFSHIYHDKTVYYKVVNSKEEVVVYDRNSGNHPSIQPALLETEVDFSNNYDQIQVEEPIQYLTSKEYFAEKNGQLKRLVAHANNCPKKKIKLNSIMSGLLAEFDSDIVVKDNDCEVSDIVSSNRPTNLVSRNTHRLKASFEK